MSSRDRPKPPDTRPAPPADGGGGAFDPRQAAALLDRSARQARRTFASGQPLLWLYRAAFVLVAFGGFWLSVRGQHPYSGPRGLALPVAFALIAVNIGWSVLALKRATAGVSGPTQKARRTWMGLMPAVWIVAYAVTAPLYHAGASHPAWGLYPANAPLLIVCLVGAATAAALRDRPMVGTPLAIAAIAAIAAVAGFGGPVGVWLLMGIGLSAVCLGTAAFKVRQQRRGVVRP